MPYTDSLIAPGERPIRKARQHWFMIAWRARYAILALVLAMAGFGLKAVSGGTGILFGLLGWATFGLLAFGVCWLGWGTLRWLNEEYLLTSRRVIHAEGVLDKRVTDSSLEMVGDAVLRESAFGRVFGYGDLTVLTASGSGVEQLRMLPDARGFKTSMLEAKHELVIELNRATTPPLRAGVAMSQPAGEAPAPIAPPVAAPHPAVPGAATGTSPKAPAAVSADDIGRTLGRLSELRDRGVITPEEFEAKQRQLLGRL